jgi:hypothetical protein
VDAFFEPAGPDRFVATELTRGPWDAGAQHAGPPAALLGRALERCNARPESQLARVTVEILRPVPIGQLEVSAEVVRPGRSVELLTAELRAGGAAVMRATGWRIRTEDIGIEVGTDVPPPPSPDTAQEAPAFPWTSEVGYHTAMEWRFVHGGFLDQHGPATVWMRTRVPLVAGEEISPVCRVLVAADSGNGVSAAVPIDRYVFINTDLTVHLHRPPAGEWVCLDAVTTIQRFGIGMAESRLFDEHGVLGRSLQSLFVTRR